MEHALDPNNAWNSFEDHLNNHLIPIRRQALDEAVRKDLRFQNTLVSLQKNRFVDLSMIPQEDHIATIMQHVGLTKHFEIGQFL